MILAMESLCETHNDLNILINDLKLHDMSDFKHQYWVDVYLDITTKFLDLCNAFSSELNRINHYIFGLRSLRHNIHLNSEEQCIEIRSILDSWRQNITVKNQNIEDCGKILVGFVESINFPKVKNFLKAKVFMKAFYPANVLTAYICNVFVTVLSNPDKDLLHISISKQSLWERAFLDLQTAVNAEIRDVFSSDGTMVLRELKCVDAKVKKMYHIIQDGDDLDQESFKDSIVILKEEVEKLDHGLDELSGKIHNFFSVTLQGRKTIG